MPHVPQASGEAQCTRRGTTVLGRFDITIKIINTTDVEYMSKLLLQPHDFPIQCGHNACVGTCVCMCWDVHVLGLACACIGTSADIPCKVCMRKLVSFSPSLTTTQQLFLPGDHSVKIFPSRTDSWNCVANNAAFTVTCFVVTSRFRASRFPNAGTPQPL